MHPGTFVDMFDWIVGGWRTIGYVALSASLTYASVVVALRLGERRTLADMTAYDFAVAVALGTVIGRTATSASPSYAQGIVAVITLLAVHNALSWLRMRFPRIRRLIEHGPIVLVRHGGTDGRALAQARVTADDIDAALRQHGLAGVGEASLVVLESSGAFSVVARSSEHPGRGDDDGPGARGHTRSSR
jgi:uncharacterized membrane protein YcaP (DUF421 family)